MSVARGGQSQFYYTNINQPQEVFVTFTVDSTNGLGVTSVKSNGWVNNVFLHTSTTPSANNGVTNPNPAAGVGIIQLKQNFNVFLGSRWNMRAPTTGGTVTSLTTNVAYVINSVGTTTQAEWNTAGLPKGFVPAVGQAFIAAASASLSGSGNVKAVGKSGIAAIDVFGDPSTEIANSSISKYSGAYVFFQMLDFANALAAPTDGSVVNMSLFFDRSSMTIDGL